MKLMTPESLTELTQQAKANPRLRQHRNIHQSYDDPCQRLLNAIEPGSYVRPHRHLSEPRDELLVAIRGLMAVITFDDTGNFTRIVRLGTEQHGSGVCPLIEVPSSLWHTVIALTTGCVLLEIKKGPFDPNQPKDLAPWAPAECSSGASAYLQTLEQLVAGGRVV